MSEGEEEGESPVNLRSSVSAIAGASASASARVSAELDGSTETVSKRPWSMEGKQKLLRTARTVLNTY